MMKSNTSVNKVFLNEIIQAKFEKIHALSASFFYCYPAGNENNIYKKKNASQDNTKMAAISVWFMLFTMPNSLL